MNSEIERRRTFAIIAHPDAGKTSLTEKLLLFGGQIQVAGAVKSNKIKKTATSDWMDIEKQRGISVTTSVMEFDYNDYKINILDTPGHQDFAEDTYRTLTAVDSVIIVVDGAKGVETQTRKLMEVCRMRNTPVIIFVNKMDREAKDPFDLLDELEEELIINVRPLTWPIESGPRFKGVYNLYEHKLNLFQPSKQVVTEKVEVDINTEELDNQIGAPLAEKLRGELELVDGVYPEFNVEELSGMRDAFSMGDYEKLASIIHRAAPLWEMIRINIPRSELKGMASMPPEKWGGASDGRIEELIKAVEQVVEKAKKIKEKVYGNRVDSRG